MIRATQLILWAASLVLFTSTVAAQTDEPDGGGTAVEAQDGSGETEGPGEATSERPNLPSSEERPAVDVLPETPASVVVIDIDAEITPGMASFVRRALSEADTSDLVIIRIDTFGGRVDAAVEIRDALLEAEPTVVAFVHNRAISAGALIAYAADVIVFGSAASMGAATPIQVEGGEAVAVGEKVVSYMRAEIRATADANGRRTDVAEAMVDRTVVIEGVVNDETLLTVTTGEAVALEIADGVSASLDDLVEELGAADVPMRRTERNWAETLAMFLTSPAVSSILMTLGLLGLWIEIKAPGFGIFGAIGVSCLFLFFFGHAVVDLAGWEEVILVGIGIALLIAEVFVIPGFGIAGIGGIIAIVAAFTLAMINVPLSLAIEIGFLEAAVWKVSIALLAAIVGTGVIVRYLPPRALPDWLVLRAAIEDQSGAGNPTDVTEDALVGQVGFASTDLRPSGKATIEGRTIDVISAMAFVERGTRVRVTEVAGVRVVVEPEPERDDRAPTGNSTIESTPT